MEINPVWGNGQFHAYSFPLPVKRIYNFGFSPPETAGEVSIKDIRVVDGSGKLIFPVNLGILKPAYQIQSFDLQDKSSVYPEYLPPIVTPAVKRFITPLVEALHDAGVKVYAPTERLIGKKAEGLLYYRSDTHWNARGAYEAFEGFREYVGLPALPPPWIAGVEHRGDLIPVGGFKHFPPSKGDHDALHWDPPLSHAVSEKTAWIFWDSFAAALTACVQATFVQVAGFPHSEFEQVMSSRHLKPDMIIWVVVERNFGQAD